MGREAFTAQVGRVFAWAQALTAAGLATTAAVVLPGLLTPARKQA